jgi:hypothetical protein
MGKEKKFEFNPDWYEVWMKQSKEFFETANSNLKDMFEKEGFTNPENYSKLINEWLDLFKKQWQRAALNEQQKAFESYFKMTNKMCNEAVDRMREEWIKRSHDNNPIKNMQELYELWLDCCQDIYKKTMLSKDFQQAYSDYMNALLHFFKSAMPK